MLVAFVCLGSYSSFHHCLKMTAVKQYFPVMALVVSIFRTAEKFECRFLSRVEGRGYYVEGRG